MVFKFFAIPVFLFVIAMILVVDLSFYDCQKENEVPQNNPPVASVYASQQKGSVPLNSRIKIDGTDKDGKSE